MIWAFIPTVLQCTEPLCPKESFSLSFAVLFQAASPTSAPPAFSLVSSFTHAHRLFSVAARPLPAPTVIF